MITLQELKIEIEYIEEQIKNQHLNIDEIPIVLKHIDDELIDLKLSLFVDDFYGKFIILNIT